MDRRPVHWYFVKVEFGLRFELRAAHGDTDVEVVLLRYDTVLSCIRLSTPQTNFTSTADFAVEDEGKTHSNFSTSSEMHGDNPENSNDGLWFG
jgi:hypothetical protein